MCVRGQPHYLSACTATPRASAHSSPTNRHTLPIPSRPRSQFRQACTRPERPRPHAAGGRRRGATRQDYPKADNESQAHCRSATAQPEPAEHPPLAACPDPSLTLPGPAPARPERFRCISSAGYRWRGPACMRMPPFSSGQLALTPAMPSDPCHTHAPVRVHLLAMLFSPCPRNRGPDSSCVVLVASLQAR